MKTKPVKPRKVVKPAVKQETKPLTTAQRLDAIGIEVIRAFVASGESLRSWAVANGFVQQTVINWIEADEDRVGQYAGARSDREDTVFDSLDEVSTSAVSAKTAVEIAGLRLKSDNIKWKLARMNAKKFGDKVTTELTGANGGPVQQSINVSFVAPK